MLADIHPEETLRPYIPLLDEEFDDLDGFRNGALDNVLEEETEEL